MNESQVNAERPIINIHSYLQNVLLRIMSVFGELCINLFDVLCHKQFFFSPLLSFFLLLDAEQWREHCTRAHGVAFLAMWPTFSTSD